jgi:hypothetical protein
MRKTLTNGQPRLMETDHVLVDMGAVRGRGGGGGEDSDMHQSSTFNAHVLVTNKLYY